MKQIHGDFFIGRCYRGSVGFAVTRPMAFPDFDLLSVLIPVRGTFFLCKLLFKNKFGAKNICFDIYITFLFTQTVSVPCI